MDFTLSPAELFIGFGGLTALFLTLAFMVRIQRDNIAGIWLIGFCLANSFVILIKFLYVTGYIFTLPHFLRLKFPVGLTRPVFFFLFILYLYKGYKKLKPIHLLHFIPVGIVTIYFMPFFFSPAAEKVSWLNGEIFLENALLPQWYFYFISAYSFGYLAVSFFIFIQNRHLTQKLLNTSIFSIYSGTALFLVIAISNTYTGGSVELNNLMYMIVSSGFMLISFLILASPNSLKISQNVKYQSSNINQQRSRQIFNKARQALLEDKLYKDPQIKLVNLADKIDEPSYLLSHAINQETSATFNDFINQMRVEEAAYLIAAGRCSHLTLEAIGYEVGFNSRSSFYSAFKKLKNNTPASFKKTLPA
jgi:AraC-like DNA-binding protein